VALAALAEVGGIFMRDLSQLQTTEEAAHAQHRVESIWACKYLIHSKESFNGFLSQFRRACFAP
jgi:hypothetical protein